MFRVAVTGDFEHLASHAAHWDDLGKDVQVAWFNAPFASADETVAALRDFDAITLMRERLPLPRAVLEQLPRLKLIVFSGNTNHLLDVDTASAAGIVVCNSNPDLDFPRGASGGQSPAELAMALMLECAWHTGEATRLIRQGGWAFRPGTPLRGKTLGIIGYGNLGAQVSRMGQAFGMEVIASSRSLTNARARADNVERTDFNELLTRADIISVHLRLDGTTRGLIGAKQIDRMKDGVIVINTARAQIISEEPFLEALHSGKIAMAGLDVFWEEPLARNHPLMTMPNVVMTPHIGYATRDALTARYRGMFEILREYCRGNITNVYDRSPNGRAEHGRTR
jgi:D-3-phosphoglycerate dehydrogenase